MPTGDESKYGRLKDNLSSVLQGVTKQLEAIWEHKKFLRLMLKQQQQNNKLSDLVSTIESVLEIIEGQQHHYQETNKAIMNKLLEKVQQSFYHLGLTENQEQQLLGMVTDTDNEIQELFDKNLELEQRIAMLRSLINL